MKKLFYKANYNDSCGYEFVIGSEIEITGKQLQFFEVHNDGSKHIVNIYLNDHSYINIFQVNEMQQHEHNFN